jgi:hypothetical protein
MMRRFFAVTAMVVVVATGTIAALPGTAHASPPPGMIQVASCTVSASNTTQCALSGTMTDPKALSAGATAVSYSTPEAVTFQLTLTCYQKSGATPVVTSVEGGRGPLPITISLWSATGQPPSSCTISGTAAATGLTGFTATLYYLPQRNSSAGASAPDLVRGPDRVCVRDMGAPAVPFTKVAVWACGPAVQGESWTYRGDELKLRAPGSVCAAVGRVTSGSPVIMWLCDGAASQIWVHRSGEYVLKAGGYKDCLTDPRSSTANGKSMIIAACSGARDQQWSLP